MKKSPAKLIRRIGAKHDVGAMQDRLSVLASDEPILEPPSFMTPPQRAIWNRALEGRAPETWSTADEDLLTIYVMAVSEVSDLHEAIQKEGGAASRSSRILDLMARRDRAEHRALTAGVRLKISSNTRLSKNGTEQFKRTSAAHRKAMDAHRVLQEDTSGLLARPVQFIP